MIGTIIKRERERRQLTQEQLAKLVGVRSTTIYRWENGGSVPLGINRRRLMEVLQLDAAAFEATTSATLPAAEAAHSTSYTIHIHIHVKTGITTRQETSDPPTVVNADASEAPPDLPALVSWLSHLDELPPLR